MIKIEVNKIVDITENKKYFKGRNVIRQIDIKIIETGIFWKKLINLNFFCTAKNNKQPEAISQNLAGIKK